MYQMVTHKLDFHLADLIEVQKYPSKWEISYLIKLNKILHWMKSICLKYNFKKITLCDSIFAYFFHLIFIMVKWISYYYYFYFMMEDTKCQRVFNSTPGRGQGDQNSGLFVSKVVLLNIMFCKMITYYFSSIILQFLAQNVNGNVKIGQRQ